jgi:hypothetical protein
MIKILFNGSMITLRTLPAAAKHSSQRIRPLSFQCLHSNFVQIKSLILFRELVLGWRPVSALRARREDSKKWTVPNGGTFSGSGSFPSPTSPWVLRLYPMCPSLNFLFATSVVKLSQYGPSQPSTSARDSAWRSQYLPRSSRA